MPLRATLARAVLPCLLISSAVAADSNYQTLRQAPIADAFVVENVVLKRDLGVLTLKTGTIGLTAPVMGRDTVAVFSGDAEFTLTPKSVVELNYLKTVADLDTIKESFDRAVFYFTDDTGKELRGQLKTKAPENKLADILNDVRKRHRKESNDNIEAGILADLYREGQPGFFSIYLHGRKHPEMQFSVKPRGALDMGPEEVQVYVAQPSGIPDELWYHSHLDQEIEARTASSEEDHRVVAAESYTIETSIARNDHFTATTKMKLRALGGGERMIPFGLLSTLRVTKATLDGKDVEFIQEDKKDDAALWVVLPAPLTKDRVFEIAFEYQGDKVVSKEGGGNFAVGARQSWYPNVNTFHDHAMYDLTFRIPKNYTLVSIGKLEKEWTDKDQACSHWVSEVPLAVAGFNYGSFKKKSVTDQKLGITIDGYATTEAPDYLKDAQDSTTGSMAPSSLIGNTLVDAQNALNLYAAWFGKSEFSRLAITQQPQFNFGQSWPSLVYLPMLAYLDSTQRFRVLGGINNKVTNFVDEVTAHEVAHQYWGHMVGWATYHDQWLSEGFASFSAGLCLQYTRKNLDPYLQYWDRARKAILEKNKYGRRPNDAGPVWLGTRLITEKNFAYSTVVYDKGAYVLHMLRYLMWDPKEGDRPFIAMMHDFVQQYRNKNASTEGFQEVVEKHMRPSMDAAGNHKMDWFFYQWVLGSAIPKYKLDYTVTEQNGKFLLKGTVAQSDVPADFVMPVPIYLDFDGQVVRMGAARLRGSSSMPIEVELPKRPKRVMLNYFHDVLEQ
jgi:hypothetical protein